MRVETVRQWLGRLGSTVMKGTDIRDQFGINQWLEQPRVITSLEQCPRSFGIVLAQDSYQN